MSSFPSDFRAQFYTCGGTMTGDDPSYVEREADAELFAALRQGQFCYVLTARQMGKSSLMVRASRRLQAALRPEAGAVALLDLSAIGQNASEESWYYTLLTQMGKRLGLSGEMRELWRAQTDLPPLQRWIMGIEEIVLKRFSGPVVIFLDEIDMVRGLTFKTDEFFIAIRALYNRRALEPGLERLTFCLLGVATPSDLIQDAQLTPFNIGKRIELTDFSLEEAAVLKWGMSGEELLSDMLLKRVLYWTGGHPYLTQCLCQAISKNPSHQTTEAVDELCDGMFLSGGAREKDINLQFVRDRLLKSAGDIAAILELYRQVLSGHRVADSEADQRISVLRLSGVARVIDRHLAVRNRIYARVFNREWILAHMPDAELRRQKAAYRKGIFRALFVSGGILAAIALCGMVAFIQWRHAVAEGLRASAEGLRASAEHRRAEGLRYTSDMALAQIYYDRQQYRRLAQALTDHLPSPEEKEDLRGWEWGYYWQRMHRDLHTFQHKGKGIVYSIAFSPDGKMLASSNGDGSIRFWDTMSKREMPPGLDEHNDEALSEVFSIAFSPKDSNLLASCSADGTIKLWDVAARRVRKTFSFGAAVNALAFSPDGKYLAAGDAKGVLSRLDMASGRVTPWQGGKEDAINAVAFSPDGRWLVAGYAPSGKIRLLEASSQRAIDLAPSSAQGHIYSTAISPDNRALAIGRNDGTTEIWDIPSRHRVNTLHGHTDTVHGLAFSPDGKCLATGSWDNTIRLWNLAERKTIHTFIGHTSRVTCVAFSRDGSVLASGAGNEVKFWDTRRLEDNPRMLNWPVNLKMEGYAQELAFNANSVPNLWIRKSHPSALTLFDLTDWRKRQSLEMPANPGSAAFSPDHKMLAMGSNDGTVRLQDLQTGKVKSCFPVDARAKERRQIDVCSLAFSSDGKLLAAASGDPAVVTLWEVATQRLIGQFQHSNAAQRIAFSPQGTLLAVANWQGHVFVWNYAAHTGKVEVKDVEGWAAHSKSVTDVAFSADGRTLATGSEDHTVKLWNVATKREMITFRDHKEAVYRVQFSPDGRMLATLDRDHKICLYSAALPREVSMDKVSP